jgi:hypothetical protein
MQEHIELHSTDGETLLIPKAAVVIIRRPKGSIQVGTTNGTWRWAVIEKYEDIVNMLS